MKLNLLLACAALALSGCATYMGSSSDDGVIYGADGTAYDAETGAVVETRIADRTYSVDANPPGMAVPIWKQPSPSGHEMGGNRPEFEFFVR
jgi:hypothetical protein